MNAKPALLFYCQHSLGMGHLVRAFGLVRALTRDFNVVLLNGGRFPEGINAPPDMKVVDLPPLGMDNASQLVSLDDRYSVEEAKALRRRRIMTTFETLKPAVILVELFPFGRKKFADEIVPLLEAARAAGRTRPKVLCSLRDILVGSRGDKQRHDDRAARLINDLFDAVLVHADPGFVRLEESFRPSFPLQVPVHYTGFVTAVRAPAAGQSRERCLVVSAGGGMVGAPLFRAAVEAQRILAGGQPLPMRIVAGPFLPEQDWKWLQAAADDTCGLELVRSVPDLGTMFGQVAASVSQCGYNTAMELLASNVAALVVPFAEGREDEQSNRARRLQRIGLVRMLEPAHLNPAALADALRTLADFQPSAARLSLDGARNTVEIIGQIISNRGSALAQCGSVTVEAGHEQLA